ncbi:hypothetical protein AVEN_44242-1 [Araneus ventricosus]|uniref:Uncharacterized protein n=1 Tax=Araneus ventricosus TaxID=182803 RepID=A0A4Y2MFQ6_ARAVE|nr:hypothetical protein AVEN_44242-1 [Araneus ventricosus]
MVNPGFEPAMAMLLPEAENLHQYPNYPWRQCQEDLAYDDRFKIHHAHMHGRFMLNTGFEPAMAMLLPEAENLHQAGSTSILISTRRQCQEVLTYDDTFKIHDAHMHERFMVNPGFEPAMAMLLPEAENLHHPYHGLKGFLRLGLFSD